MSIYVKSTNGAITLSPNPVAGNFQEYDSANHPIVNGYQLYRIGRLISFIVTDYKKGSGRISNWRQIGILSSDYRPITDIQCPMCTSGGETDHSSNPGTRVLITSEGIVQILCNYDTGSYCSWNCMYVSQY